MCGLTKKRYSPRYATQAKQGRKRDLERGHQDAGEGRVGEQGNPPESARSEHQDTQEPRRLLENYL